MSGTNISLDAVGAALPGGHDSADLTCAGMQLAERLVSRRAGLTALTRRGPQDITRGEVNVAWCALVDDAVVARRAGTCTCLAHLAQEHSLRTWVVLERLLLAAADSVCAAPTDSAVKVAVRFVDAALVVLDELREHADDRPPDAR